MIGSYSPCPRDVAGTQRYLQCASSGPSIPELLSPSPRCSPSFPPALSSLVLNSPVTCLSCRPCSRSTSDTKRTNRLIGGRSAENIAARGAFSAASARHCRGRPRHPPSTGDDGQQLLRISDQPIRHQTPQAVWH